MKIKIFSRKYKNLLTYFLKHHLIFSYNFSLIFKKYFKSKLRIFKGN